jgi:large subunit ribosomal protein L31e
MAKEKKKDKEKKIVLERKFNVHIRNGIIKAPKYKRAKKAIIAIREYLARHMKSDKIKIGKYLNLEVWSRGIKNPPAYLKITAKKDEEGNVFAEIEGAPIEIPPEPEKKEKAEKKEGAKEEKKEDLDKAIHNGEEKIEEEFKHLEEKTEKIKEEKQEKAKEIQKEEISELRHEHPKHHAPKELAAPKKVEQRPMAPAGRSEARKP